MLRRKRLALVVAVAMTACQPAISRSQDQVATWMDAAKPVSWNKPGLPVPTAPTIEGAGHPRCKDQARPAELDEDKRVRDQGWDLVGAYQGGWDLLVIRGTAGYDGMCRPRQYQDFVFVRETFAGTLSPQPMDSRADGALIRMSWSNGRLTAEYARYATTDPLCCPSRTTSVVFEMSADGRVVRPVSAFTHKQ